MLNNPQEIILINKKKVILKQLESCNLKNYMLFSEKIASETTHTLYHTGHLLCQNAILNKWENAIKSSHHMELGGFVGEELISHISLYKPRPHHPFEQHILEFGIAILEEYCHIGLGSKKLSILENIARNWQVKRIQAKVRTSNYRAIAFYQKHGYEIEGVRHHAVFINGNYENEFFIAKLLK